MKTERDRKMLGTDVRVAVLDRLLAREGHDLSRIRVEVIQTGLALRDVIERRVTGEPVRRRIAPHRGSPAAAVGRVVSRDLPLPKHPFDGTDDPRGNSPAD